MSQSRAKDLKSSTLTKPLTKSRFRTSLSCPTKLYYAAKKDEYGNDKLEDRFLKQLARGGFQVGALAKLYFPGGVEIETLDYEKSVAQTEKILEETNVTIFEAAFRFENLFIRADIVKKEGDILYLYEVKAKSINPEEDSFWQIRKDDHLDNDWKEYLFDVAFQYYVIQRSHPELTVVPHLYLADKTKTATVEGLNQRFKLVSENGRDSVVYDKALTPKEIGEEILVAINVKKEVTAILENKANGDEAPDWPKEFTFGGWVSFLSEKHLKGEKVSWHLSGACKSCEFYIEKNNYPGMKSGFEECWSKALTMKPEELEKRKPIFEIWRLASPALIEAGVHFIDQLTEEDLMPKTKSKKAEEPGLSTSSRKILQWERTLKGIKEPYFDRKGFETELKSFTYPLHFIDFETTMTAIPFNQGLRPYEMVAFQFSHHVLDAKGNLRHSGQWLCTERGKFPNFDFVRTLKKELETDQGTIFRYASHENTVLCQIRDQLLLQSKSAVPDRDELIRFIETVARPRGKEKNGWKAEREMVDLMELVLKYFWHPRMRGSNSIKLVLPAILECSDFLQNKYGKPIYGANHGIPSLNYRDRQWVFR